jgi:hypothetical protein
MDGTLCSSAVASPIPTRKPTPSSLLQKDQPCRRWLRPLAHAGTLKRMRENAKDLGLDHYEVRCFIGWYRYITLVLLALAFLTGLCATERFSSPPPAPSPLPARPVVLAAFRPRSAPSACTAHLALFIICLSGSGMPRGGVAPIKVVPAIPTRNVVSRLADPGWPSHLCSRFCSLTYFPDIQEISRKCWSSWKSVSSCLPWPSSRKEFCI